MKNRGPKRQFDPATCPKRYGRSGSRRSSNTVWARRYLGRLAPTLQALPTVIWHTPLEQYVNHTVAEIRQLKTHGEKRVRVVLEVFHIVHEVLAGAGKCPHLSLRLVPSFIQPIENWLAEVAARPVLPTVEEIRDHLAVPLLNQIKIDAGDTIHELSESRLGINGPPQSVRQQAKRKESLGPACTSCSRIAAG